MADVSQPSSLTLEPNPFEQSFASNTQQGHAVTAAPHDAQQGQVEQPDALRSEQGKHSDQQFAQGANDLTQKTPIPGIGKMMTPLPLAPGAPPFGSVLAPGLNVYGPNSPAGWMPHRFGPITPGSLNTPSLDAFGQAHAAAGQPPHLGGGAAHMFPHAAPGVPAQQVSTGGATPDVSGLPRIDAFGNTPRGVLPLESPGIPLVGINPQGATPQHPPASRAPGVPNNAAAAMPTSNGGKPLGENAAANGLYMLSQNQATEKGKDATTTVGAQAPVEAAVKAVSPGSRRRESQQSARRSVDSTNSSAADESLSSVTSAQSGQRTSAEVGQQHARAGTKRGLREVVDKPSESDAIPDDDGERRRWSTSQQLPEEDSEDKRKQFLERNRIAAIKCRARKKQWVDNLQQKVDVYARANDDLLQKNEKMRLELDELRQFIIRYHNIRSLPQHILQIVQGSGDAAQTLAAAAVAGQDFGQMQSHIIAGASLPSHAPLQPTMQQPQSLPSVPSGPQAISPSMVASPAPQRQVVNRGPADQRYPSHGQAAQAHFSVPRAPVQQLQHIHQTSQ